MAVALVRTLTGSLTQPVVWSVPPPATAGVRISMNSANATGNWLICWVTWQQTPSAGFGNIDATMTIADTSRNHWVPLVTSPSYGTARTAIWACPAARAVDRIMVSPTGPTRAMVVRVSEFSGLPSWLTVDGIASEATYGTSLIKSVTPSQSCFVVMAGGSSQVGTTLTQGGTASAWTLGGSQTVTNGVDATGDAQMNSGYLTTAATAVSDWALAGAQPMCTAVAAIKLTPTVPTAPNANWPYTQLQAGFGSGPGTPRDQITWTDLTARMVTATGSRGRQYELDQLQAGTATFHLRNNDGYLDPTNGTSPYSPNVQMGTPLRVLATWAGITYPVWFGYAERWPQSWDDLKYGWCDVTATDAYAALTTTLPSATRSEKLIDAPYAYWPLSDGAGNASGANLASSQQSITKVVSKAGPGSAAADFGANGGAISGDGDATGWGQLGLLSAQYVNGYSLQYSDTNLPAISDGVTVELWARAEITQPTSGDLVLMTMKGDGGVSLQLHLDQVSGYPTISTWDQYTRARSNTAVGSWGDRRNGGYTHYVLVVNQTGWALHINGDILGIASGACNLSAAWNLFSVCGQADKFATGNMINGSFAHVAIYPRKLDTARIINHFGTDSWFTSDLSDQRIIRHLAHAPAGVPRAIDQADTRLGNEPDTTGRTVADCLWDAVQSDNGLLYVDGGGAVQYRSKAFLANLPTRFTLGDNPGETPMLGGVTFDFDSSQVKNDVTVSQVPGQKAADGVTKLGTGVVANATDPVSIARFGDLTYARTSYVRTGTLYVYAVTDLANWLRYQFSYPQLRTETITIDPASNPAVWPVALGIEIGDTVTVSLRPTYRPQIVRIMQVQQVVHTIGPGSWKVTLELTPADPHQLTVDDPALGVLDGGNAIGY